MPIPLQHFRGKQNGLICTCVQGRERVAIDELSHNVSRLMDIIAPTKASVSHHKTISSQLEEELSDIRKGKTSTRIGTKVDIGKVNCLVCYALPQYPSSTSIAEGLMKEAKSGGVSARFLQRILPFEFVCHCSEMADMFTPWVRDHIQNIKQNEDGLISYKVEFKSRFSQNISRSDVHAIFDEVVVPGFFVDLVNAKFVFIVEVIKNVMFCGLVQNWNDFKKYNINSLMVTS
ncbi:hypothetical protein P9112_000914 [Eukaryota sp. TZLM1-RC]